MPRTNVLVPETRTELTEMSETGLEPMKQISNGQLFTVMFALLFHPPLSNPGPCDELATEGPLRIERGHIGLYPASATP